MSVILRVDRGGGGNAWIYSFMLILGNIGGYLGLFVGASMISVIEVILTWMVALLGAMGIRLDWLW